MVSGGEEDAKLLEGKKRVMEMLRSVLLTNKKSPSPGSMLCFDLSEGAIVITFLPMSLGVEDRLFS
jgi:hypothetical protein